MVGCRSRDIPAGKGCGSVLFRWCLWSGFISLEHQARLMDVFCGVMGADGSCSDPNILSRLQFSRDKRIPVCTIRSTN